VYSGNHHNLGYDDIYAYNLSRKMLKIITDIADPLLDYTKDDPVRPEISREFRVARHRFVAALVDDTPRAMVCVSLRDMIPSTVDELGDNCNLPTTAIFYTIWSYSGGAAGRLIFATADAIRKDFPSVTRFVTLSPKTEMARKFHLRNGATVFRENQDTINYEYLLQL
jgi:hypothetical protein